MTPTHLLPCPCGRELPVKATQAGQQVVCECGRSLEVPTMRELSRLKRAEPARAERRPAPSWGARQAVMLLGAIITAGGLAAAAVLYYGRPQIRDIHAMSPYRTWLVWQQELRPGLQQPAPWEAEYAEARKLSRRLLGLCGTVAGLGVLTMICSLLIPQKGPGRRRKPPPGARRPRGPRRR